MLKKHFSTLRNRHYAIICAIFHVLIIGAFAISLLTGHDLTIDGDLFNMLPSSTLGKAMGVADDKLTASTSQAVYILVSHKDFETAKSTAEEVYGKLKDNKFFLSLSLYNGLDTVNGIEDFVHGYRWNLLSDEAIEQISSPEGAQDFADAALATAGGFYTLSSMQNLDTDPFMLDEQAIMSYVNSIQNAGASMSIKDGVLASEKDGVWYVFMNGILSKEGSAIASSDNGVTTIYSVCNPLEKDGVRFAYSGVPFNSHKSSNNAVSEIGIISSISLAFVAILLLAVFRSSIPLIASLVSIALSMITAFAATHLVFSKVHILSVLLGTSLIGSCIDYSLHFFMNWKGNLTLNSGAEIRRHLRKGLVLSLASTIVCYITLLFAPFNLLKQMGVFSSVGIMSSFLTVVCLYPLLKVPQAEKRKIPMLKLYHRSPLKKSHLTRSIATIAVFAVLLITLIINHDKLRINNDMYHLYEMEGRILEDTNTLEELTSYSPKGWFIISGETEEEVLQNEELICRRLDELGQGRPGFGYLATSSFIPSRARQEKSIDACRNLLPLLDDQLDMLGIEPEYADEIRSELDSAKSNIMLPGIEMPETVSTLISPLWLGIIDGKYYSVVLPVMMQPSIHYKEIAAESDNLYFEDKMADLGKGLDKLTALIFILFGIAYLIIVVVLKFFYSWRQTIKIARIPLLCILSILNVFIISGNPIEFFCVTGMILVFGLGLDYMIYMVENMKRTTTENSHLDHTKLEPFSIIISFVTTAVSFGALAFSSFVPVHAIGLSICTGIIAAYIGTVF